MWRGVILIVLVCLLSACRSETFQQAMTESIPFYVEEVIHTEKLIDGAILMYTTKQIHEGKEFEALTTAYLEGNDKIGWTNEGNNHWDYDKNQPLMVYYNHVYDYDHNGKLMSRFELTYGRVDNTISRVEGSLDGKEFVQLELIENNNNRYFFETKEYPVVRGLNAADEVITERKQRK